MSATNSPAATSKLTSETASNDSPLRSSNSLLTSRSEMTGDQSALSPPAPPSMRSVNGASLRDSAGNGD